MELDGQRRVDGHRRSHTQPQNSFNSSQVGNASRVASGASDIQAAKRGGGGQGGLVGLANRTLLRGIIGDPVAMLCLRGVLACHGVSSCGGEAGTGAMGTREVYPIARWVKSSIIVVFCPPYRAHSPKGNRPAVSVRSPTMDEMGCPQSVYSITVCIIHLYYALLYVLYIYTTHRYACIP